MKIDHLKLQDESEVKCVERFITVFNKINNSNYIKPIKNENQNEIDVFCFDGINELKIQVKKIDFKMAKYMGTTSQQPIGSIFTRGEKYDECVLSNIKLIEDKYLKQNKNMSDIILLLDELGDPPEIIINKIKEQIKNSIFEGIWLVTINSKSYKLY